MRQALPALASSGADVIHLDVMDGRFVPPISFGDGFVKSLRPLVDTEFEAHLMIANPERQFEAFAAAGCKRIIYHYEATPHAHRLAQSLHHMGLEAGVAINPATPVEVLDGLYDVIDLALVMTINPGWGGQPMIEATLEKVRRVRRARPDLTIEIDGGVDPETLPRAIEAGANAFVIGSYLANSPSISEAMKELRAICD